MHILRIASASFKDEMEFLRLGLKSIVDYSYSDLLRKVLNTKANNVGAISSALRDLGYNVTDIIYDVEWLQRRWAEENNFETTRCEWWKDILAKQIDFHKPDLLLFQHSNPFKGAELGEIKKQNRIRSALLHTGFLGSIESIGPVDHIFAATPSLVNRYRKRGFKSSLMYHYFDESLEGMFKEHNKVFPFTFVGSSGFSLGYQHSDRYWLLRQMFSETQIIGWLLEPTLRKKRTFKEKLREVTKKAIGVLPHFLSDFIHFKGNDSIKLMIDEMNVEKIARSKGLKVPDKKIGEIHPCRVNSSVAGLRYLEILAKSLVTLHIKGNNLMLGDGDEDIGAVRLFEATGLGCCLICDTGKNMGDLFEEGEEIITFSNTDEAIEKANFLVNNPRKALEIAKKGKERTLKNHTASCRAPVIENWIRENL